MPFKVFASGAVLTAADVNDYMAEQAVITCTSTTRPTPQEGMTIYETDTDRLLVYNGVGWRGGAWNAPWGVVGYVKGASTDQSGIGGAATDITGLSVTWTTVANRLYVVTLNANVQQNTSTGNASVSIANAANVSSLQRTTTLTAGSLASVTVVAPMAGLAAGTWTSKARASTDAGTLTIVGTFTREATIIVEDVGPNGVPA